MAAAHSINALRELYLAESTRIRQAFTAVGDGKAAIRARAELVDKLVRQTSEVLASRSGLAVVALGGYGRGSLFPFSDVDLLFLCADDALKAAARDGIRRTSQDLW